MINPMQLIQTISGMMRGGNPQTIAQQILKNNPQFAQMIQGQSPQTLAQNLMQRAGMTQPQIQQLIQQLQNETTYQGCCNNFNGWNNH